MAEMVLRSKNNGSYKLWNRLRTKKRAREQSGLFIVEGEREFKRAVKHGYRVESLLFSEDKTLQQLNESPFWRKMGCLESVTKYFLKPQLLDTLLVRKGGDFLAILQGKTLRLEEQSPKDSPSTVLLLDRVEKPGNLGALLRTADACGIDQVLVLEQDSLDLYHPHVIRASLGACFTLPVTFAKKEEIQKWCDRYGFFVHIARFDDSSAALWSYDFKFKRNAVLLGNEAKGVNQKWSFQKQKSVHIPMLGSCDSLNVSVAGGILMYEASRQANQ